MQALADAILVLHFAIALFIVAGLLLAWLGAPLRWRWIRNWSLRALHLGAIVFVAAETLLGIACPLTVWEDALRGGGLLARAGPSGFVERWVSHWLYYDFPPWVFAASYVGFAALTALTWRWVPPHPRK
jgi:hypothetical protein